MNILFASSECSPFAQTGGLGEVLGALPATLRSRGHSVAVVMPLYRQVIESKIPIRLTGIKITVPLGSAQVTAPIFEGVSPQGVKTFFVQRDEFFDRSSLYGTSIGSYDDNASRFIFFSKVVVELARYIQPTPEILHLHDWQTGLVPALTRAAGLPFRTVYTIHNLAYQGSFWAFDFNLTNLPGEYFTPAGVEFYGRLNLMKAGITLAHQVTTVSKRYAEEIQTEEYGYRLDGVLRENNYKLTGILNGVDYERWNPEIDSYIVKNYSARALAGKEICKQELLKKFGFAPTKAPVFGIVSRLAAQKGFDLLRSIVPEFLERDLRLLVLGSGDAFYEDYFRRLAKEYPEKVAVEIGYDEALCHHIEAGADFFLMPSFYEPCGLNQLYSLRYGTIPVVHDTGGLADSIQPWKAKTGEGTGFKFSPFDPLAFKESIEEALRLYEDKKKWPTIRRQAMRQVFSWSVSAAEYEKVYKKALK